MSNMPDINKFNATNTEPFMKTPSLDVFHNYLEWFPNGENPQPLSVADDARYWTEFYENIVPEKYLAEFGGVLTALLDSFLECDEADGRLSSEEHMERFCVYQAKIIRALVRYDMRVDAMQFHPMNLKKDSVPHLMSYLASLMGKNITKTEWDDVAMKVIGLINAVQTFPHDLERKLGYNAINRRLQMLMIPYRILQTDDGYKIIAEVEGTYDGNS